MGNFFTELKRRHIYRVAAAYAVVAWVLLQIVNNVAPGLNLPNSAVTLVIVILAVGFPIALIFAWILQLASKDAQAAGTKTSAVDWLLASVAIAVIGIFIYQQVGPAGKATQQAIVAPAPSSAQQSAAISIAVLPFANLSGDAAQEFFSDGITEEITSALAKVPKLPVVGRISTFQFKGPNKDLRAIRQALSASYLIDGSVRKEGDRLRITAQLIQADSGANVWTESYDRQLTSVFAIQEEIAKAIAGALRVPLGLQQGDTLVSNRTDDLNSYEQYLRARALYRTRSTDDAIKVLEPLVLRDQSFAAAWGLLAESYVQARRLGSDSLDKAERAGREAIRLNPRNAPAYAALADVDSFRGRWTTGEDGFRKALALDPNEPDIIDRYSTRLAVAGRIKEALGIREKLPTLEPFVAAYKVATARFMISAGQTQAAIAILEKTPTEAGTIFATLNRNISLARAYAMEGRYAEAADTLLAIPPQPSYSRRSIEDAGRLLRSAPQKAGAPESLPALEARLSFVYAYVGAFDRILDNPERTMGVFGADLDALWEPEAAPLRKTERFKKFTRDSGLFDYWRERSWPDMCRPSGSDDFACD